MAGVEPARDSAAQTLAVVVPVFNEAEVLPQFHARLTAVLDGLEMKAEIVFVDDGSSDDSRRIIAELAARDERITLVELSRNFGKELALTAGLDYSRGDATVVIDADLQDPPELIPKLVAQWRAGSDVVYATRSSRAGETLLKRFTAAMFYRVFRKLASVPLPSDTGDFRLLDRGAVRALQSLRERHRFMKGLFVWIGFRQTAVEFPRDARQAGQTKWNYWRLLGLAVEGLTSFSTAPLRISTFLGLAIAAGAFVFAVVIIVQKLVYGNPILGYPSLMVAVLFLGGVNLVAVGLLGEYVARVFGETKGRPLYIVRQVLGRGSSRSAAPPAEPAQPLT